MKYLLLIDYLLLLETLIRKKNFSKRELVSKILKKKIIFFLAINKHFVFISLLKNSFAM